MAITSEIYAVCTSQYRQCALTLQITFSGVPQLDIGHMRLYRLFCIFKKIVYQLLQPSTSQNLCAATEQRDISTTANLQQQVVLVLFWFILCGFFFFSLSRAQARTYWLTVCLCCSCNSIRRHISKSKDKR